MVGEPEGATMMVATTTDHRAVVVTGASSGIGRASVEKAAARGWQVFAGVRDQAAADRIRQLAPERIVPIRLDITEPDEIEAAAKLVGDALGGWPLTGLFNNAGTTWPCPIEYLTMADFRRQLEVNLIGHLAVIKAFLPQLRRPGGRILATSSPGAKIAAPFMAGYVAAKAGLEGICAVLRTELRPDGIDVSVIEPGFVATDMRHKLQRDTEAVIAGLPEAGQRRFAAVLRQVMAGIQREAADGAPPEVVADAVWHALTDPRPKVRYPAGPGARRVLTLAKLLPERVMDRVVARMLKAGNGASHGSFGS
jgi:NAD(P)-dependent dehydrogenase (short-subunit alcohol dehydrogenase family)